MQKSNFKQLDPPRFNYVDAHAEDRSVNVVADYIKSLEIRIAKAILAIQDGEQSGAVLSILQNKNMEEDRKPQIVPMEHSHIIK